MPGLIRRYGFAAVVTAVLAVMAAVVLVKSVWPDGSAGGGAAAMSAGKQGGPPGGKQRGGGPGGDNVAVQVAAVSNHTFTDAIQGLGSAQARESIVITPKVQDAIRAIRFESGQRVRRGQVLVELSSVEQQADLAEAVAANAAAQEEYRRFQALAERGFAPRARLEAAQAAAGAAQARVTAGRSRMDDRVIRAPFNGVMGLRLASPGQLVRPGDQIGTLDDLSQIKLDFDVAEARIANLRPGVEITATTAAFPNEEFRGRIAQIDSRISADTRAMRVRAVLPNPNERLRSGMLMNVRVQSNPREALAAPEQAVVDEATGSYVYLVAAGEGGGQVAERRTVRTGQRTGGLVEIVEGLAAGDRVITEGVTRVRPDAPVRIAEPGAPAPGASDIRGRGPQSAQAPARPG